MIARLMSTQSDPGACSGWFRVVVSSNGQAG
jgi:hypothetical protein